MWRDPTRPTSGKREPSSKVSSNPVIFVHLCPKACWHERSLYNCTCNLYEVWRDPTRPTSGEREPSSKVSGALLWRQNWGMTPNPTATPAILPFIRTNKDPSLTQSWWWSWMPFPFYTVHIQQYSIDQIVFYGREGHTWNKKWRLKSCRNWKTTIGLSHVRSYVEKIEDTFETNSNREFV